MIKFKKSEKIAAKRRTFGALKRTGKEKNMKFKVGDKVRAITNNYGFTSVVNQWEGVVTAISEMYFSAKTTAGYSAGVLFTRLKYKDFELIGYEKSVHIYSDGKTTIATLKGGKVTVRTAVAKCSPEDEFDLKIGAKLAIERLFEEEPKKDELKYKAGDRVRIVKEKTGEYWNPDGHMDKWLGKTMTITHAHAGGNYYRMKEDAGAWFWYPWMIEGLAKPLVIKREGKECGIVGTPTGLQDIHGKDLFVGDVVRVCTDNTMWLVYMVESLKDEFQPSGCGFGWKKNGTDVNGWKVEKLVDWIECKSGDKLGNCRIEEK